MQRSETHVQEMQALAESAYVGSSEEWPSIWYVLNILLQTIQLHKTDQAKPLNSTSLQC